jgi:hypothetical protein
LLVDRVVSFDAKSRRTRFINCCAVCGNYDEVIGATPAYLEVPGPLEDGIFRSDLLFGSGNAKHPLIIVGLETKERLEGAGLKGLLFREAYHA